MNLGGDLTPIFYAARVVLFKNCSACALIIFKTVGYCYFNFKTLFTLIPKYATYGLLTFQILT